MSKEDNSKKSEYFFYEEDSECYKLNIFLRDIETVKKFVTLVNGYNFPVFLVSNKYIMNGKSIMGIFGLDLSQPLELRVLKDCPEDFKEKMQEFVL